MAKPKGPTFEQAHDFLRRNVPKAREVEERLYVSYVGRSRAGRSTIDIVCPYCKSTVEVFIWSLAGGGKRCTCGALFGSSGTAYHWAER